MNNFRVSHIPSPTTRFKRVVGFIIGTILFLPFYLIAEILTMFEGIEKSKERKP